MAKRRETAKSTEPSCGKSAFSGSICSFFLSNSYRKEGICLCPTICEKDILAIPLFIFALSKIKVPVTWNAVVCGLFTFV